MSGRKRAVFLINSLTGGGAERVMCTLLRHSEAEREEFDVTLGLLDVEPAAHAPPDWVDVRQFDCRHSLGRSVLAVRRLFNETRPDVTLSFLTRSNVASVLNARAPCIISERANTSAHLLGARGAVSRSLVRMLYPRASRVIAVSDGVGQDLRDNFGVAAERLVTIPNPVDAPMIEAQAAQACSHAVEGPYVLAAGRLVKSKNFDMLIRAFATWETPRKLVIIGEGPEREALLQTARELGVADRVVLPGFLANPYPLMRGADFFVLSSNSEGFPNALVEAMTLGVPVIATNCASGPAEILAEASRESIAGLTQARHGVLVAPNAPEQMSAAMRIMDHAETRRAFGEKAAARARAFGADVARERYWQVIREAMAQAPRARA